MRVDGQGVFKVGSVLLLVFAVAFAYRQRLWRASPDGTRVRGFGPSLFLDDALKRALTSGEDRAALQAMQERGWLGG